MPIDGVGAVQVLQALIAILVEDRESARDLVVGLDTLGGPDRAREPYLLIGIELLVRGRAVEEQLAGLCHRGMDERADFFKALERLLRNLVVASGQGRDDDARGGCPLRTCNSVEGAR